jgi:flagellar biosynthesis protein FliP
MDEMVNPCNRDIAERLVILGLAVPVPHISSYRIMNQSFRNFILTQVGKVELQSFRKEADEKGAWSKYQLPLIIVIMGISAFLFTTQKDAFINLVTYMGAAVAGIAGLLKLLGVIPNSKA